MTSFLPSEYVHDRGQGPEYKDDDQPEDSVFHASVLRIAIHPEKQRDVQSYKRKYGEEEQALTGYHTRRSSPVFRRGTLREHKGTQRLENRERVKHLEHWSSTRLLVRGGAFKPAKQWPNV